MVDYNLYQLLGIQVPPAGTEWTLSTDYLSDRGLGGGTRFEYHRPTTWLGWPGDANGFIDAWGIRDTGRDVLGGDRRSLIPEETNRGRILAQHRSNLPNNFQLTGEIGWISDRNFLEQYFEREWDQLKDQSTGVELKQMLSNGTWSVNADARLNDFFTQTEWLPKFDHFLLGQDLFGERFTWTAHSQVGYGHLRTASAPTNPVDLAKFQPLAWERDSEGIRAVSRQELAYPLELGPVKFVPYLLGEAAYWGEDISGDSIGRALGQTGVRASMSMWRVDPDIRSELMNVNGIAQKIVFDTEVFYASSTQDMSRFPLYDALDDDSQEHFRRRFFFNTFDGVPGGSIPLPFDERYYALRSGLQSNVTSPSVEVADDLVLARLGMHNRWQTKRGPPGREHIVDLITLDLGATLFPHANRDNFGESIGLINYDFKYHIGDRLSLLSDGYADLFDRGLRQVTAGVMLGRPEAGNFYAGFRSTEGPFHSALLLSSVNYRMSEKWIANAGAAYDLSKSGNVGGSFGVTRVGEAFLVTIGSTYDLSRGNLGVFFGIEPRILPSGKSGYVGGVRIPPPGTIGLE
jgi:hypothetical protein